MGIGRASGENRTDEATKLKLFHLHYLKYQLMVLKQVLLNFYYWWTRFNFYLKRKMLLILFQKAAGDGVNIIFWYVNPMQNLGDEVVVTVTCNRN